MRSSSVWLVFSTLAYQASEPVEVALAFMLSLLVSRGSKENGHKKTAGCAGGFGGDSVRF
jgi:hypothetical protein